MVLNPETTRGAGLPNRHRRRSERTNENKNRAKIGKQLRPRTLDCNRRLQNHSMGKLRKPGCEWKKIKEWVLAPGDSLPRKEMLLTSRGWSDAKYW